MTKKWQGKWQRLYNETIIQRGDAWEDLRHNKYYFTDSDGTFGKTVGEWLRVYGSEGYHVVRRAEGQTKQTRLIEVGDIICYKDGDLFGVTPTNSYSAWIGRPVSDMLSNEVIDIIPNPHKRTEKKHSWKSLFARLGDKKIVIRRDGWIYTQMLDTDIAVNRFRTMKQLRKYLETLPEPGKTNSGCLPEIPSGKTLTDTENGL